MDKIFLRKLPPPRFSAMMRPLARLSLVTDNATTSTRPLPANTKVGRGTKEGKIECRVPVHHKLVKHGTAWDSSNNGSL